MILLSGLFPPDFKTAIVRPPLKKPSLAKNCLKNYCPVSNLSFLSKLLENFVLKQLLDHLSLYSLLNPDQFACRAAHRTETALLKVLND